MCYSGGSGAVLVNHDRFPTMLRLLPYQQSDLVQTLVLFMRKYAWTDVSLLCDQNAGLGNFFTLACQGFQDAFNNPNNGFTSASYFFDTSTESNFDRYLRQGAGRSRGTNITRISCSTGQCFGMIISAHIFSRV